MVHGESRSESYQSENTYGGYVIRKYVASLHSTSVGTGGDGGGVGEWGRGSDGFQFLNALVSDGVTSSVHSRQRSH